MADGGSAGCWLIGAVSQYNATSANPTICKVRRYPNGLEFEVVGADDLIWLTNDIPGASELIAWFGYWPSFHDAEVVSIELARSADSRISVHTFDCTDEVNLRGQYICQRHVVVTFLLNGIEALELSGFNQQNVVSGVTIAKTERGYEVKLEDCYGVAGAIEAKSVRFELSPGPPHDSQYLTEGAP